MCVCVTTVCSVHMCVCVTIADCAVPDAVVCLDRWRVNDVVSGVSGDMVNVTVVWAPPVRTRGVLVGYILNLTNFTGGAVTRNVVVDASRTFHTFMETLSELTWSVCSCWYDVCVCVCVCVCGCSGGCALQRLHRG